MRSPWKACNVEFKHAAVEKEEPSTSSSGDECCVSFRHCRANDDCTGKTEQKLMNYFIIKPAARGTQAESRDKVEDDMSKNTVVLQCGGIPCTFNVMVYKQQ